MNEADTRIRKLRVRAVNVPMGRPVHTSGGAVTSAPYVLLDLERDDGAVGSSYIFCYTPRLLAPMCSLLNELADMLAGASAAPMALEGTLGAAFRLAGYQGLAGWAASGIDMAAWDAMARAAGLPLARLLGSECLPIPAYNSCGLGIIGAQKAGQEARDLTAPGFHAIKVRLGYPTIAEDLAVVEAVRGAVGPGVTLMSDYNQSLSVPEAQARTAALAQIPGTDGLYWVEEPTRFDDYAGHADIRAASPLPIQMGENCWGPTDMAKALDAGACDFFMPDLGKILGVTGWMRAVGLATPRGLPLSSHLYPEVSAQVLAATPTRHWLEYVDWANPILRDPLELKDGKALPATTPGSGIAWDEAAVAKYAA